MEIKVKTFYAGPEYTLSKMSIDGVYKCDTLEDVIRPLPATCPNTPIGKDCKCKGKVWGKTAIPAGRYECIFVFSSKFQRKVIMLLNVPHFIGILIHGGNIPADTHGCLLVGENKVKGKVINSIVNLDKITPLFADASLRKEKIFITIER